MNILIILTGLLMALADTMPGLSGGTICFIMGYYDKLLSSIKDLLNKDKRKSALIFLIKIGVGWIVGLVVGVLVIEKLLATNPYMMISFFLGLVIISIPMTFKSEVKYLKDYKNCYFAFIGAILVILISSAGSGIDLNLGDSLPIWVYGYAFFVAVCAISAMLLPGISGSTILLIFGIYQLVLTNIKTLITDFNFQSFGFLLVFGLGVLFGAFFISKIISNAFKNHRSKVLYFIMGLLIGSIYAIYNSAPLIEGVDGNNFAPFTLDNLNIIALILGIFAIIGIEIVKNILNGKKD